MRRLLKWLVVLSLLGGAGYFGFARASVWLKERNRPEFRTVKIDTGDIRISVNASGEIKPVLSVHVGSFVSGPIDELFVDFNDEVVEGQLLATIDPRIYLAAVERDSAAVAREEANLRTRKAEVERVKAELQRARNDEQRSLALKAESEDYISQAELDQFHFSRMSLEAQLGIADASILQAESSVRQAKANLENSQANLNYTKITSPVDGIVIERMIDPGQTLAAQFQAPELFVIAPQMREKLHIFASIDEADIGLIRSAHERGLPVHFKVDAYGDRLFTDGVIEQIRLSSQNAQNVVTYPVVVSTPNSDMKLLPGMTANMTFLVDELKGILRIPNAALRYMPDKAHVRPEDQSRLELNLTSQSVDSGESVSEQIPADEIIRAAQEARKRMVWVREGEKLKAVDIVVGVSDYRFTQVVKSDLKDGDEVVTGLKKK
ncbi:MAG: efflux RND transporter periplasmic adaptor subunit [Planctomycetaceae bacterium]|nr:efflux RND transporter periplasmic adaptor subunit [Planctomycetaceae bacterium]